jgi:hypothetical protein
LLTSEVELE